ncbi:MAG: hypothetical protein ACRD2J_03580 [Thermoanaerobaculia bacterium]
MTTCVRLMILLLLTGALPAGASAGYRLDLELNPAAPFPFLERFGSIDISVFSDGVSGKALVLRGFSRNGSDEITVMHRLARVYLDIPIPRLQSILLALSGSDTEVMPGLGSLPVSKPVRGRVGGLEALRYRIQLGPESSMDVWTTTAIEPNPHYLRLAREFAATISQSAGDLARQLQGMPVYIEMNTTHHRKVTLLRVKGFAKDAEGASDELRVGSVYVQAPGTELIFDGG